MTERVIHALQYAHEQLLTGLAQVGITTEKHGNLAIYSAAAALILALPVTYSALKSRPVKRFSLENEVVIVTGGASGIGLELVTQLLAKNSKVVVFDINKPTTNGTARFYQTDVTDREQVLKNAERVRKEIGEPSVLINNVSVHVLVNER
jgi:D-arabinose 1-dehydrogenase-like Zn-dependent alcohol dehydrogenase